MDLLLLAIYLVGIVGMALVIRVTTPPDRLDRGAAFVACLIWPGAAVMFMGGAAMIAFQEIFWPEPAPKRE